jgi:Obg family GTPase CgtA-like protein
MKSIGLWDKLRKKNIKNGDIVSIYNYKFVWNNEEF